MRAVGAPRIGDFVVRAFGQGEEAVRAEVSAGPARDALRGALAAGGDLLQAAAQGGPGLYDRVVRRAAVLNTPLGAARAAADPRHRAERNRSAPRKIGSHPGPFACINCAPAILVSAHGAHLAYASAPRSALYQAFPVRARA